MITSPFLHSALWPVPGPGVDLRMRKHVLNNVSVTYRIQTDLLHYETLSSQNTVWVFPSPENIQRRNISTGWRGFGGILSLYCSVAIIFLRKFG